MSGDTFWVTPGVTEDLLDADARVLVVDRRWAGGRTEADFTVHTWEEEAEDLLAVIDHASPDRPVDVVGASNGCSAAATLALNHPGRVRTLVLAWPAAPARRETSLAFIELAKRVEERGAGVLLEPGAPGRPWSAAGNDERFKASLDAFEPAPAASIVRDSAIALLSGELLRGVDHEEAATLADTSRDVWVIPTEDDEPMHPHEVAAAITRAVPGCRRGPSVPHPLHRRYGRNRAVLAAFLRSVIVRPAG